MKDKNKMDPNWINISAGVITVITGFITIINAFKPKPKAGNGADTSGNKKGKATKLTAVAIPKVATTPLATVPGVQEFSGDDEGYQNWVTNHLQGYVINTYQNANATQANYMSLHQASCRHISNFEGGNSGAFTAGQYMKVCATDVASLRDWVKVHGRDDGSFTGKCHCSASVA